MKTYAYALSALLAFSGSVFAADAAAKDAKTTTAATAKPKTKQLTGEVVSTDAVGNTIVIKGKKADQTFSVPATAKISEGKKDMTLADITAGTKVTVKYTEEAGAMTASSIQVKGAAKTAKMKKEKEAAPAAK